MDVIDRDDPGLARPGSLTPGQTITVLSVRESGELDTIVAKLGAVFGHLAYGRLIGLLLVRESGKIDGIAGVLDAVPERTSDGRILVLRLTDAQDIDST